MKTRILLAALLAPGLLAARAWALPNPVDEPLPLVGTADHGHTYPGATAPFGMVQLSPDTPIEGWDGCSGYHYSDSAIVGFSHTHLSGTGCGCLGDILLMPATGEIVFDPKGYASPFSHAREKVTPGDYRVFLDGPQVAVELTATARCGFHQYTFPASESAHFILDLEHGVGNRAVETSLTVENGDTVSGSRVSEGWGGRRAVYFVMRFSKPFSSVALERDGSRLPADAREGAGRSIKAAFNYSTTANETILVKVALSGTGIEGAHKNLAAEIPGWGFEAVRAATLAQWKNALETVQAESFDPHLRETFYANMYLSFLAPDLFNDVDGSYRGMDHTNHPGEGFQNYTTYSLWDTYRAENPLLILLQPRRVDDMIQSLLAEYRQLGQHTTPIWPLWGNETWCMIGYHSVAVIADAYLKGFRGFDAETAYQALRDTAMQDRNGLRSYKELGYVASKPGEQATSRTIEYAYDDWCLARMAESLGYTDDARMFYQRAANYRNLFDGTTRFFRGRKAGGAWRSPFVTNALVGDEYTEADAWQYAFGVQQDVPGMIALYGGDQPFIEKLDSLFTADSTIQTTIPDISGLIGQYSQGDEQCHHVAYLYDYAGAPFKTQQRIRQVMATLYNDTPAGQCGNADCGQMAAWYVFSALGFYPMNPDSGVYAIGSPVVTKAVMRLDPGKYHGHKFTVLAKNNSAANIYIQSASLNGQPLNRAWITHQELTNGGTLRLVMGPNPNPAWGSAPEDRPPATMPADFHYAPPPAPASDKPVAMFLPIRIICGNDEPAGDFLPDPNIYSGAQNHRDASIDLNVPNAAPAAVYQSERYGKDFAHCFSVPARRLYHVRLHFAEIFDDGAGQRVENIQINERTVLPNLDVFSAAGGMNKALVRDFEHIAPDANGNIVVRVSAAPGSPDQNAKINGIEILEETGS
jgi:predicted alpha-1,2-mannosidase